MVFGYRLNGLLQVQASETAELVEKLEDSQMTLGSMASNRYSAPFREDVNGWITKLSTVSEIVEQWLMVQSMWMYMEAVFSGGDIVKQLPQEAKRFQNIDKSFMKVRCCMLHATSVVAQQCSRQSCRLLQLLRSYSRLMPPTRTCSTALYNADACHTMLPQPLLAASALLLCSTCEALVQCSMS